MLVRAVAPYVGAWIETNREFKIKVKGMSHPTWVRGLKPVIVANKLATASVAPYVGAWIETKQPDKSHGMTHVAPYVGAWIETPAPAPASPCRQCRTLRGCVD